MTCGRLPSGSAAARSCCGPSRSSTLARATCGNGSAAEAAGGDLHAVVDGLLLRDAQRTRPPGLDDVSVVEFLADHGQRLVEVRRDLHAHPGAQPRGATYDGARRRRVGPRRALADACCRPAPGWSATSVPSRRRSRFAPTSMRCRSRTRRTSATARTVDGVAHACGHDVHTTVVLGAGLALQRLAATG